MKIRTRLTIKNICTTATALIIIFLIINVVSEYTRSKTFFRDLIGEAITKANLFLQEQVEAETMQSIYLNNQKFINEVEVAVYTTDFQMLYHDAATNDIIKEDRAMIDRIVSERLIEFYVGEYQGIGIIYNYEGVDYIVTAAAYDGYGYDNLRALRRALVILFFVSLVFLFVVCYFMASGALKPLRHIISEAENITSRNIDKRLVVKNKRDELGELCGTINDLLSRLENSFNAQKQFVGNVSHELRTPLAALIAQLDLALQKERSEEEYKKAIEDALGDAHKMNSLIDGLLNLAKADYNRESIKMQEIRLDELLLDVRNGILKAHPDYNINLVFEQDNPAESDDMITVCGNIYLLSIALSNLIENNCKYSSDHSSFVLISFWEKWAIVRLSDNGAGMSEEDKENLFRLFYRGANTTASGHGIGMTLAQKIINLHEGHLAVHSQEGEGTTFVIELPHI